VKCITTALTFAILAPSLLTPSSSLLYGQAAPDSDFDATEVVRRADQKTRGRSSRNEVTVSVVRPTYTRDMSMISWSLGDDYFMILVTEPKRDEGTTFLKRGKEIWNWIPSIERTVKLPPSMMSQNWMGTDFTNDDLVKQASIIVDYSHALVGEEEVEGLPCWKIELIPKEDAAVVWGRILLWIDKEHDMMLRGEYYDEDDYLINVMMGKEPKEFDGLTLPAVLEMIPAEEEGQKTVMSTISLDFDITVPDGFFTVRNMRSVRESQ
jgi:outer membrane lipoprotein-sorting protein